MIAREDQKDNNYAFLVKGVRELVWIGWGGCLQADPQCQNLAASKWVNVKKFPSNYDIPLNMKKKKEEAFWY